MGRQGDIISDNTQQRLACAVQLFMFPVKDPTTGVMFQYAATGNTY